MKTKKINSISIVKNAYVSSLANINPPLLNLHYAGELPTERRPTVAIIGSRKPSSYGQNITAQFASALAKSGVIVVSGLAFGVDAIAHKSALDVNGTTIAVLANGLHRVYPASHEGLAKEIVKNGGAIISEQPMGYEARRHDFLRRNRIISGLADAVLVTEATIKSGTLSTVAHALEQGKEVFAVPGPVNSPMSAGANLILQQGAHIALHPNDILQVIAPELLNESKQTALVMGDTPVEDAILKSIQNGSSSVDEIVKFCKIEAGEVLEGLTMLELKGVVRCKVGVWSIA